MLTHCARAQSSRTIEEWNRFLERHRESLVLMNMEDPRAKSFDQAQALLDELLSQPWNAEAAKHYE